MDPQIRGLKWGQNRGPVPGETPLNNSEILGKFLLRNGPKSDPQIRPQNGPKSDPKIDTPKPLKSPGSEHLKCMKSDTPNT